MIRRYRRSASAENEPVQQNPVVPNDEIAGSPAMYVDELPLRRVFEKLGENDGAFGLRQPDDMRRVIAEIQRLAAGLGMGAHQRVIDLRQVRIEGRAERDPQPGEAPLCRLGQRLVSRAMLANSVSPPAPASGGGTSTAYNRVRDGGAGR